MKMTHAHLQKVSSQFNMLEMLKASPRRAFWLGVSLACLTALFAGPLLRSRAAAPRVPTSNAASLAGASAINADRPNAKAFSLETVVLSDDFEGATTFVAANSTVNAWVIGTAAANGGTKGAYISNNAGVSNAYTNTVTSGNHIYAPITVPVGETAVVLSFDWRGLMDYDATIDFDYLRVSVRSAIPVAGTMPTAAEQIPITYSGQDNYTRAYVNLPASVATGTTQYLVFSWVNDTSVGTLPAAIDNVLVTSQVPAPLIGTKAIPGDYPSIGAAIANLNANGADTSGGSLTFNVAAGSIFTETPSPLTVSGSSTTNRIIFQKAAAGVNPKVLAEGGGNFGAPQTSLTSGVTSSSDAIIAINSADFVTFDGIDVQSSSPSLANPFTKVEYGYLLRNNNILANVTTINGAQNNIIQNTSITLDRRKTSPTIMIGIMQSAATGTFGAGSTATSAAQANSGNKYYNLTIQNAGAGIYLLGTAAFPDDATEVGVTTGAGTFNSIGTATANDIGNGTATTWGIRLASQSNAKIFNNEIRNITGTSTNTVAGIHMDNSGAVTAVNLGTTQIYNNIIHDLNLTTSAASGVMFGIRANLTGNAGSISRIQNNFIYGLNSSSTVTTSVRLFGIQVQDAGVGTGATHNVHNNSVRIAMTNLATISTCFGTGGAAATNPVYNVRNNIFANVTGTQAGAAKHYTWVSTSNTSIGLAVGTVSDFNDLYVTGTNGFVGRGSTIDYATLANWQAMDAGVGPDDASISADPALASATDLHITGASPAINAGTTIATVTDDIDGQTRPQAAIYDIGADEFVPSPGVLQLSSTTYSGSEGGSATPTVSRVSGSSGIVGVTYTLTDGTATGGAACTAGVDYINPGPTPVSLGDTVTTLPIPVTLCTDANFEGAQAFTITLSLPTGGATLGSPTAATVTINDVAPPFNGSYNVGTGQILTSLTNAGGIFDALNTSGATGNVTINITSDLSGETGAIALNEIAGGFTVTIKPTGAPRAISASTAGNTALIKLNGADGVTIDGSLSGGTDRSLTITNTGAAGVAIWIATNATSGANSNTVKNCIIQGSATPFTTIGGVLAGSGATFGGNAESGRQNSNNTIQNNLINRVQNAAFIAGDPIAPDLNWAIIGNDVGSATVADKMGFRGFFISNSQNFTISRNVISGINSSTVTSSTMSGIQVFGTIIDGSITRNQIKDIRQNNTTGWGSTGIGLGATSSGANLLIANNFISDIASQGFAGNEPEDNGYGIVVATGGGYNIYHNTVVMNTNQVAAGITAALLVDESVVVVGGINLRNNILGNIQTVGTNYSVYVDGAANLFSTINNNDYWTVENVGFVAAANQVTLANWQTATAQDAASQAVDPLLVNNVTNLHLQGTSPLLGDAIPLVGIVNDDFDNDLRDDLPDIGADEIVSGRSGTIPAGTYRDGVVGAAGLAGNTTFTGVLALTGILDNGPSTLTIDCAATVTGGGAGSFVIGNVKKNFCAPGAFTYPVGTFTGYSPVEATSVTPGGSTGADSLAVKAISGPDPLLHPSSLQRHWDLNKTGLITANIKFNFLAGDLVGGGVGYTIVRVNPPAAARFMNAPDCPANPTASPCVNIAGNFFYMAGISNFSRWTAGPPLVPTAAGASISGRVTTADGRGIANTRIMLTGGGLTEPRVVATGQLGIYNFEGLPVGQTYVITVQARRFTFANPTQVVDLSSDVTNADFVAEP